MPVHKEPKYYVKYRAAVSGRYICRYCGREIEDFRPTLRGWCCSIRCRTLLARAWSVRARERSVKPRLRAERRERWIWAKGVAKRIFLAMGLDTECEVRYCAGVVTTSWLVRAADGPVMRATIEWRWGVGKASHVKVRRHGGVRFDAGCACGTCVRCSLVGQLNRLLIKEMADEDASIGFLPLDSADECKGAIGEGCGDESGHGSESGVRDDGREA